MSTEDPNDMVDQPVYDQEMLRVVKGFFDDDILTTFQPEEEGSSKVCTCTAEAGMTGTLGGSSIPSRGEGRTGDLGTLTSKTDTRCRSTWNIMQGITTNATRANFGQNKSFFRNALPPSVVKSFDDLYKRYKSGDASSVAAIERSIHEIIHKFAAYHTRATAHQNAILSYTPTSPDKTSTFPHHDLVIAQIAEHKCADFTTYQKALKCAQEGTTPEERKLYSSLISASVRMSFDAGTDQDKFEIPEETCWQKLVRVKAEKIQGR